MRTPRAAIVFDLSALATASPTKQSATRRSRLIDAYPATLPSLKKSLTNGRPTGAPREGRSAKVLRMIRVLGGLGLRSEWQRTSVLSATTRVVAHGTARKEWPISGASAEKQTVCKRPEVAIGAKTPNSRSRQRPPRTSRPPQRSRCTPLPSSFG